MPNQSHNNNNMNNSTRGHPEEQESIARNNNSRDQMEDESAEEEQQVQHHVIHEPQEANQQRRTISMLSYSTNVLPPTLDDALEVILPLASTTSNTIHGSSCGGGGTAVASYASMPAPRAPLTRLRLMEILGSALEVVADDLPPFDLYGDSGAFSDSSPFGSMSRFGNGNGGGNSSSYGFNPPSCGYTFQ